MTADLLTASSKRLVNIMLFSALVTSCQPARIMTVTIPNLDNSDRINYRVQNPDNTINVIVVVCEGDTLHAIARRYGVSVKALITINQLQYPFQLRIGQTLVLQPLIPHPVGKGETLYSVALQYKTQPLILARVNGLVFPYRLFVGQILSVPSPISVVTSLPTTTAEPWNGKSMALTKKNKSSLDRERKMITYIPCDKVNRVDCPNSSVKKASNALFSPRNSDITLLKKSIQDMPYAVKHTEESVKNLGMLDQPTRAITSVSSTLSSQARNQLEHVIVQSQPLLWPITGRLVGYYGSKKSGAYSDGISIAAPLGTPVKAANNGIVVYVGSKLKSFGNLLLIKHTDNLLTAYAHHDHILVRRGEIVKRGQVVGTVGVTGNVRIPQLYFEVRRGVKAVDPVLYLKPS